MDPELERLVQGLLDRGASDAEIHRAIASWRPPGGADFGDALRGVSRAAEAPSAALGPSRGVRAPTESTRAVPTPLGGVSRVSQRPVPRVRDAARLVGQGALFGFGDEVVGNVRGAITPGLSRATAVEQEREAIARARADFPKSAFALEVGGGLTTGLGLGALAGANVARSAAAPLTRSASRRILGSMAGSAVGGATAGAGEADGDLAARIRGAGQGALFAGAVGGLFPLAAAGGRGVKRAVAGAGNPSERADELILRKILDDDLGPMGIRNVAEARHTTMAPKPEWLLDLGGENTRRLGRVVRTVPGQGSQRLTTALRDRADAQRSRVLVDLEQALGPAVSDVAEVEALTASRAARARPLYEEAYALGDVDSPAVRELLELPMFQRAWRAGQEIAEEEGVPLRQIYGEEGPVRRAATRRRIDVTAPDVPEPIQQILMGGKVEWTGGLPKFRRTFTEVLEQQYQEALGQLEAAAGELERRGITAWSRFDPNAQAQRSATVVNSAGGRAIARANAAERRARELERELVGRYQLIEPEELERRTRFAFRSEEPKWHRFSAVEDDLAFGDEFDRAEVAARAPAEELATPLVATPDVRTIDYIKQGLDRRIETGMRAGEGAGALTKKQRRALIDRKRQLLGAVDEALGPDNAYSRARAVYADDSRLLGATRLGARVPRERPEVVGQQAAKLAPGGEREAFRRAAVGGFDREMRRAAPDATRATPAYRVGGTPERLERLRPLFESEADFARFRGELERELAFDESRRLITSGSQTTDKAAEILDFEDIPAEGALSLFATGDWRGALRQGLMSAVRRANGLDARTADIVGERLRSGGSGLLDYLEALEALRVRTERAARRGVGARAGGTGAAGGALLGQRNRRDRQ